MSEQVWYHIPPKRSSHKPRPKGGASSEAQSKVGSRSRCAVCSQPVVRMSDDSGPESLASMFNF